MAKAWLLGLQLQLSRIQTAVSNVIWKEASSRFIILDIKRVSIQKMFQTEYLLTISWEEELTQ